MTREGPDRFRIYRLGRDDALALIATCSTAEAVGVALVTLAADGEFDDADVGVLDRPDDEQPGDWVVSPWSKIPRSRGRRSGSPRR